MIHRSRAIAIAVLTPLAAIATAGTAYAATDYNFGANFKYRLSSASWTQGAGTDSYWFHCTSGFGEHYAITLYRKGFWSNVNKGSVSKSCDGPDDNASWSGLDSGTYFFTLTKADDGVYIVGSGHMRHP